MDQNPVTLRSTIPADEYGSFYAGYVARCQGQDPLTLLAEGPGLLESWVRSQPEEALSKGYAPGKWSIKEVIGHMIDAERVFAYRAFRISRGDKTPMEGFEENDYVKAGDFNLRSLDDLFAEYHAVRAGSMAMLSPLTADQYLFVGIANGHAVSLRAQVAIMAGHERHHLHVLKERYETAG